MSNFYINQIVKIKPLALFSVYHNKNNDKIMPGDYLIIKTIYEQYCMVETLDGKEKLVKVTDLRCAMEDWRLEQINKVIE